MQGSLPILSFPALFYFGGNFDQLKSKIQDSASLIGLFTVICFLFLVLYINLTCHKGLFDG